MGTAQSNRTKYFGILGSHPLFASLPANVIHEIETELIWAKHEAGSILYNQGERVRGIFLVFEGRVKLSSVTMHARTALLKVAGAGEMLGLAETLCNHEHVTTGQVTTSSLLAFLDCYDLMNSVQKYPELSTVIVQYLAKELIRADHETLSLRVPCSSAQRLAAALLHLSNGRNNGCEPDGDLAYTHAELAQLIGASRETVTRLMKQFEQKAMVVPKKSALTIIDPKRLERTAELG